MAWRIEYGPHVERALRKIGFENSGRILAALEEVVTLDDPRQRGKALTGQFSGLWRYRVGDYRVIAKLEDGRLVIVVIAIGHRRDLYRR